MKSILGFMPLPTSWYLANAVDWDMEKSNVQYVLTEVILTVMF